jgi:hypothetical protein
LIISGRLKGEVFQPMILFIPQQRCYPGIKEDLP